MNIIQNVFLTLSIFTFFSRVALAGDELINFEVGETGVYEVTFEDLLATGLDLTGEPVVNFALTNKGQPVPLEVTGSVAVSDEFGAGSTIRFIGKSLNTLYTNANMYTLSLDPDTRQEIQPESIPLPARVSYASSYLATKSYAPQNEYTFASPDPDEPWYAKRISALRESAREVVQIDLPNYLPGGNSGATKAKMKVKVWGGTNLLGSNPDHHLKVAFNGQPLIDETFDGLVKKEFSASVSNLTQGANSVALSLPLDHGYEYEVVNLDEVTIDYPRAFIAENEQLVFKSTFRKFQVRGYRRSDVTVYREATNNSVTRMTEVNVLGRCESSETKCVARFGGAGRLSTYYAVSSEGVLKPKLRFLPVPEDIRAGNAEYLIITHPDFIADEGEIDLLLELKNDLDSSFSSVDIVDVEQIYAQFGDHIFDPNAIRDYISYSASQRGTLNVLLVGGDIYDYHGYQNADARTFIPSIYVSTGALMNFAPVDAKYVDLDNNDTPDLAIGRLPVRSMSELGVLLDKRRAYLERNYLTKAIFVADKFDDLQQYSFKLDALSIQQEFFGGWDVEHAFLDDLSPGAARAKIVSEVDAGVSLISFKGHSSTSQWSFSGLFTSSDASRLNNIGRPAVVTQWGCWNTYYVNPSEDSMGHRFMMEGPQGAVAVLGATTLTSARNEKQLAFEFFKRIESGDSLGEAMVNAKAKFAQQHPEALDVILGWTLLGFPELIL